jgi:dihydrofolate synthase/folylpolyglutamate synthase
MKTWRVPYPKFGEGIGLQRVSAVAEALGIELARFGANGAVITGSNGKGSTTAMLAAMLQTGGGPVGRFTSPHLFALNERFALDGEDVADDEVETHWVRVSAAIDAHTAKYGDVFGGFEFLFLVAASLFAARDCVHTVWEAGIGGRYDPVRLIQARHVALTSLDLEHTKLLGETLELIAYDKIDAAPEGALLFAPPFAPSLRDKVAFYCGVKHVTPVFVEPIADAPLLGAHQRANAAIAHAMAQRMAPHLSEADLAHGLGETHWPGRLEIIECEPLVVVDVGHTPDAIRAALEGFAALKGDRGAILVCGASIDKEAEEILAALTPGFDTIICAAARHKGRPAAEIAARVLAFQPGAEVIAAEDIAEARRLALARAGANGAIYVAGGLFLATEFKAIHLGRDPARLAFF